MIPKIERLKFEIKFEIDKLTDAVDHFGLGEDGVNSDILFEFSSNPIDLRGNIATIDLDFNKVGFLLSKGKVLHLSVANSTDGFGVLLEHGKVAFDGLFALVGFPSLGCFGESLLLAAVPALVVSSSDFIGKMSGPDGLQMNIYKCLRL